MDPHILARQMAAMERHGLDALVACSKENVAYGAGYTVPSQALNIRSRQFAVACNREGRAAMLLTANELPEAQARSTLHDLRPYDEFAENPMAVLAGILKDLGVGEGKIGLEMDAIPADRWEVLKKALPRAAWEHGAEAFHEARMVKTPGELERLRAAARIADAAQAEAHAQVRQGMTEQDLYRLIVDRALAHGAEAVLLDNVSPEDVRRAVERCSQPDAERRGRRIPIECSGGIRLDNVRTYAETGVDFISVGLLTHSPQAADMSLRIVPA